MTQLVGIFIYGCLVMAIVSVGLIFAMSTIAPGGPGSFEGTAAADEEDA